MDSSPFFSTLEPHYNEVFGMSKITLLYQVSQGKKQQQSGMKSWDQ